MRLPRHLLLLAAVLLAPPLAVAWSALLRAHGTPLAGLPAWDRLLVLVLLAPVLEEIVFRAGLQDWLVRRSGSTVGAIVATSAVFAAGHALAGQGWPGLAVFVPSLFLGATYAAAGLRASIACHAWFNLCLLAAAMSA